MSTSIFDENSESDFSYEINAFSYDENVKTLPILKKSFIPFFVEENFKNTLRKMFVGLSTL